MEDVLWGDVIHVVGGNVVDVHVTYQPSVNQSTYRTLERVRLLEPSLRPGNGDGGMMPHGPSSLQRAINLQDQNLLGRHLLLKVVDRDDADDLHCEVSLMV